MSSRTPPDVVKRIYAMRTNGMTATEIANALTAEGVPTVHGRPWHPATISSISRGPRGRVIRPVVMRDQSKWSPDCFDSLTDYLMWKQASGSAYGYCHDCEPAYKAEMTEKGRCTPVYVEHKRPKRTPSPAARLSATRRSDAKC